MQLHIAIGQIPENFS